MPASMQTITAITKERYEGTMRKQLENETVALKRIVKTTDGVTSEVGGKYVTFPIHVSRNAGIGARNELERLPRPGQQGTRAVRIGLKYLYGGMELSGQVLALANTNAEAFLSALDLETQGLKDDLAKDLNRQVYGNGIGEFATVPGAHAGVNTITLDTVKYVQVNMQIDIMDPTSTPQTPVILAADRQVIFVDEATNEITLSGPAITTAGGETITRTGNYNREWTGFRALFSDTTPLFGVDPATEPVWKSTVLANGGTNRAISETLMLEAATKVRGKGGKTSVLLAAPGVWHSYFALLKQERQYVDPKDYDGGYSGLGFITPWGEAPVVMDFDCPSNTMFGINEKDLKVYREADWSFMDRDGSMWDRVPGFDAYHAQMYQYSELGLGRRNTHFVIEDITETASA